MKTPKDPRHQKRQDIVKMLYAESFTHQLRLDPHIKEIIGKFEELDDKIKVIAPEFPIEKINKVDLAVLRLGVYELIFDKSQPQKVVIDEAIELAMEFGNDSSAAFVNGALGKLIKDLQ